MSGALKGVRILDFSTLLPGPYATMCLADMGADVLRIVSGSRLDMAEIVPPFISGTETSAGTALVGRNKHVLTLNLKDERAAEIIKKLIVDKKYDIVLEQFRPGVMAKLGLGYEDLKEIEPNLIYCSLTGYGQTGPLANKAGHDLNYIALSGAASYSGKRESGPSLMGIQIADVASGSNNTMIGLLAAIICRQNTGRGQYIDVSMTDGMFALNAIFGAGYLVDENDPEPEDGLLNGGSLYDYYRTKDEKVVTFAGVEPQFFKIFCEVIGRPDLIEGGVSPKNLKSVKSDVQEILQRKTADEWIALFENTDACFEPVLTLSQAFNSPHAQARGLVVEVPGPEGQMVRQIGNPIKFSDSTFEYRHTGFRAADSQTDSVMKELGYSEKEIEEQRETGLFS